MMPSLDWPVLSHVDDLKIYLVVNHPTGGVSKCFEVSFTRKYIRDIHIYTINGTRLLTKTVIHNLGLLPKSFLSFAPHIEDTCK